MSKRSSLLRLFGTLLALALLIYLLSQQGWDEIVVAVQQIPLWRLALALCLSLISRLAITVRWYGLLRSSGARIPFWQVLRITFAGLFSSNFLPTTIGGDVVRLAGAIQYQCDAAISAASLIVDRVVGLSSMAMVLPLSLPSFLAARPLSYLYHHFPALLGTLAPGNWWGKAWGKISALARRVIEAITLWLKQPYSLIISLVYTWVHMLCIYMIIQTILAGMDEHVPLWSIAGLYSLIYFFTLIPISINGYGLQEVSITFVFTSLAGVSMNSSLITALLLRTLMLIASLPGAIFVPDILAAREKEIMGPSREKP